MSSTISNGRPQRKQLSDQLDRLDSVIDALADGLNEAVATAAKEGTRSAVKEILTELLTNPDILAMIRAASGPLSTASTPVSKEPDSKVIASPTSVRKGSFVVAAITQTVKAATASVVAKVKSAWRSVKDTALAIWHSPLFNRAVVIGTGVGIATAVVASSNHTLAAVIGGVAATATAVTVQVGSWFCGAGRRLGLA